MSRGIILSILCACLLSGCAQYRTDYTMPETSDGKACVQTCVHNRWVCNSDCNSNHENCLKSDSFGKRFAIALVTRSDMYHTHCNNDKDSCAKNCTSLYDHCFQTCGGKIHTYKVE